MTKAIPLPPWDPDNTPGLSVQECYKREKPARPVSEGSPTVCRPSGNPGNRGAGQGSNGTSQGWQLPDQKEWNKPGRRTSLHVLKPRAGDDVRWGWAHYKIHRTPRQPPPPVVRAVQTA